ncbi:MAG: hypothetical protein EHM32_06560 [Spirochaetales bacterium]|nr:MAG: hypothetical protein EHM32_06560 [Spirochaetales bacterium]
MARKETFNNLIDICIQMEENPDLAGNAKEMFRQLLAEYFFRSDVYDSKKIAYLIENMALPDFLGECRSLIEIDMDRLRAFIEGDSINDSLGGRIMITADYLKSFYPHHPPAFNKLPPDVREELLRKVKNRNLLIIDAFEKIMTDRAADRSRKVITLVALILKNIHRKTGLPLNPPGAPAETVIRGIFAHCDDVFNAKQRQVAELNDDTKIKEIIKAFFTVKKFQDLAGITKLFKVELDRYRKRALRG